MQTKAAAKKEGFGKKIWKVISGNPIVFLLLIAAIIVGCLKVGMEVCVACPEGYEPPREVLGFAEGFGDRFRMFRDPGEAVRDADVVYTDVWVSMGKEAEAAERDRVFSGTYQVTEDLLSGAKPGAMVLHCLPARRGREITDEVMEAHAGEIFEEAENRLHAQKAVLCLLMGE